MSTTTSGSETPVSRRITTSGVTHSGEPFGGVVHPPLHVDVLGPDVGGGVAGVAGGVGGVVTLRFVVGTGLGIAEVAEVPPPD